MIYLPTSRPLASCFPLVMPRWCRWFGCKWALNLSKTFPDNVREPGRPHYFECKRCKARRVEIPLLAPDRFFDREWVAAVHGRKEL